MSGEEISALTGARTFVAGVLESASATVHPGRLVRALRRIAIELGVEIYEGTPMRRLHRERPPRVETPSGTITAERVVLALYAWSAALPELRPSVAVICTDITMSEPQPERIAAAGWTGGPALMSAHTFTEALRTSTDGRVLYNKSGGALAFGQRIGRCARAPRTFPGTDARTLFAAPPAARRGAHRAPVEWPH